MSNKKTTNKKTTNKNEKTKNKQKITKAEEVLEIKETKKSKDKKTDNSNKRKKDNKSYDNKLNTNDSRNEMIKLLKIVLIVTGIMLIFYGITLLATNKADEKLENKEESQTQAETQIQYENIMIGSLLNHNGTYYVLIEKDKDNHLTEYESLIGTIKSSEDAPTIYKANLTDSFNKNYLGEESNYYVDDMADFKVTGTTLVKIQDGKIISVSDNHDAIKNKLNDLA